MYSFLCSALLVSLVCGSDLSLRGSGNVETTKINVTETERANRETVTIDVQRMEVDRDKDGVFEDAKILKVNIRVSVIDGVVHINNSKALHGSVTAFHFTAEIDLIGEDREVLKRTERVPILIRVLVLESQKTTSVGQTQKVLHVQEEIVEVNHKAVKQIKVTEVLLQLDSANNEVIERRVLTLVELEKAEIHTSPQEGDTHKYPPAEGHLPSLPYFNDKKTVEPPKLPDRPYKADTTHDGLCSKFHKLPFGVRMAVFVLVTVIGLGTVSCCIWVFCCKPPAAGKKIDLKDYEDKFAYDGEFEAPALEQKIPIEKQKLVIDA